MGQSVPRVSTYVRRPHLHTQARKSSRAISDRSLQCPALTWAKLIKMPSNSKALFFRSKVLTPTTLRRPSALTTGRVRPVYRYGRFPNTPTMPAEPILPPISPVVDRGSPAPAQNPVKSLKPHPPLTTQYTHMWAYTTGMCIRQLP